MHRTRPARLLVCAAVPLLLAATACGGGGGEKKASPSPSASSSAPAGGSSSPAPTPQAATFAKLPEVCRTISEKTVDELVPKAKKKEGEALASSADPNDSATCHWNGLNDSDVKNMQFHELFVSLKRLTPDPTLGSADKRAQTFAQQQVMGASKPTQGEEVKNVTTDKVDGIGNEATAVSFDSRKSDTDFRNTSVIARTANVVVTVKYSGSGYQGAKTPSADDIMKGAQTAAKEAVAAVAEANKH
ncbi:DUF3558 domain-containing protein [Streptomyces gamaensis]|uniref:DUF3558 domain-containing protein n=1 Tax=Streptomyces gamaensis TaxID=1763542 RepID=A0ABW0YZD8_9ACTN